MVWSKLAQKGGKQASGKGNGSHSSGGKGGGKTPAGGSGGAAAALAKQNAQIDKRMTGLENLVKKVLEGSTTKKAKPETGDGSKYWVCGHCGADRCFNSRQACHKCLKPRVPQPPGLPAAAARPTAAAAAASPVAAAGANVAVAAAAPAAAADGAAAAAQAPMETEAVPVETRISRLEAEIKVLRLGNLPESKALVATYEQALKAAREEQRLARPLPARFQAATDKQVKLKMQKAEILSKTATLQEQAAAAAKAVSEKLEALGKETAEIELKLAEADQELAAVKADLAAEQQPGQTTARAGASSLQGGPELIAGICGFLARTVPGFQMNEGFLVDFAKCLLPAGLQAAPQVAPPAAAAAPLLAAAVAPAAAEAAAAMPAAAPAGGAATEAAPSAAVSQVGAWAARELAAQELARISYELMLSRAAQPQAAAANAAAQAAQQNGPGTEERAAGSSPAPLSTANVELLGGMGNVRARSSSRSERRAAANLTEAQQLALFSGGN